MYELSQLHPEIADSGVVNIAALTNAIYELYPEYAKVYHKEEAKSGCNGFIKETIGAGTEFIQL